MKNKMFEKIILLIAVITAGIILVALACNYFLNKYSVPNKEERINNMVVYQGRNELNSDDVANEIQSAIAKYTNWDNLFLSANFKKKFKNKQGIIENVNDFSDFWCTDTEYENKNNVIIIYANKKNSIFDKDESDNITTKYYFEYKLNDNNEIDDLILLKKMDVYTIDGSPVE